MSIDFAPKAFGDKSKTVASAEDRPKAQFWINLGYESTHPANPEEPDGKRLFISLPQGIPLDTQEHLPTNQNNAQFAAMRSAQNDLLDQLLEHAQTLGQGEEGFITMKIQLRRIKAEAAPIDPANNPLIQKLNFNL